jgi:signal transduction histidine kinase
MRTIRQQLTYKLLAVFVLLLGLGGMSVYFSTRHVLLKGFDETLRAKAIAISMLLQHHERGLELHLPEELTEETHSRFATDFFEAWVSNSVPLLRSHSLDNSDILRGDGNFKNPKFWNAKLPSGHFVRAIGLDFKLAGDPDRRRDSSASNGVHLVVASDVRELDHTLSILAFVLVASGLLLLTATVSVVPYVLRRGLISLDQLADKAARITADSLETRFPVETLPGELEPISSRLNDLLERLQRAFERERRFSADLAHELRTPIAELRSLVELALKWPGVRQADTDNEVLAIALQMEGMISKLLALLRTEQGMIPAIREDVSVLPLVQSVWKVFAEKAASKEVRWSISIPDRIIVNTDPFLLRSILTSLLDNAVEYTPRGGMISIECNVNNQQFMLRVTNTSEHLTADDVSKMFDRFWRKDAARFNDGHSGLGLSLSRSFAHAMGFEINAALDGEAQLTLSVCRANRL